MLVSDNREFEPADVVDPDDITIAGLLEFLAGYKDRPLVFFYDGRPVRPGYHVTEVKAGQFAALDCGANPESWAEIFVQLWDVEEDRTHMPAGKFSAIIRKVTEHVGLDHSAKLTFEVSDGVRPMQLYRAALPGSRVMRCMSSFRRGRQAASRATAGWRRRGKPRPAADLRPDPNLAAANASQPSRWLGAVLTAKTAFRSLSSAICAAAAACDRVEAAGAERCPAAGPAAMPAK